MVVHKKLIATHDMPIQVPGEGEVRHFGNPFHYAAPDPWIGVCSNSRLIIYDLPFIIDLLKM